MFINPPDPDTTIEESLRMGGRHTMMREHDGITVVTSILIARLDPEPPIYQLAHVAFTEEVKGHRVYVNHNVATYDDLDVALADMLRIHLTD